jgi:pyridoxal phosphate enzyme (YggS family)
VTIAERLRAIQERIEAAAARSGRSPKDITLVAVAKSVPCNQIARAIAAGVAHVGENRVQEAAEKVPVLGRQVEWHMVGHLQSNKARRALELFDWVHSVDSTRLLLRLDALATQMSANPRLLIQVNTSADGSRFGVAPADVKELVLRASECETVSVEGMMTIGPLTADENTVRCAFRRLRELAGEVRSLGLPRVHMRHLSMGMTADFEIAIEEGATIVRIGTALFGPRLT